MTVTVKLFKIFQLQLYLGIPLEMVHGTIRIGLVYTSGVLMGSLFSSIIDASRSSSTYSHRPSINNTVG